MKTSLTITIPGEGIPGPLLNAIESAASDYYTKRYPHFGNWRWHISIDVIPEDHDEEAEAVPRHVPSDA